MIVLALSALAALVAFRALQSVRARRVGGIVFVKAGNLNFTYSRSRKPAPAIERDERQGYAPRAYVTPAPAPVSIMDDERRGYPARAYVSR